MKKLFIALAASALLLSTGVRAAPASAESVDTLLAVTKTQALLESMYGQIEAMMRQSIANASQGQSVSAEQRRALDTVPSKFVATMRTEMGWTKMRPIYVQIYQDTFTQEEIDGLIAFYRSPAGEAFVAKMPLVMQKSMQVAQAQMGPIMEKMKAAIDEAMAEAKRVK